MENYIHIYRLYSMLWLHKIISDFMDENSDHVFNLGGTLHEAQ